MLEKSYVPGRIRFICEEVHNKKDISKYLNVYIDNLFGVRFSSVNQKTGSILVIYDVKKTDLPKVRQHIEDAVVSLKNKKPEDKQENNEYYELIEQRDKSKGNIILYGVVYAVLKIKDSIFGISGYRRSEGILKAASVITIILGYPVINTYYKKFTKHLPTNSDIILSIIAFAFTILRESTKGVMVLFLKALNDFVKYRADVEGFRLYNQSLGKTSGIVWFTNNSSEEVLYPVESLKVNDVIRVKTGEIIPIQGEVLEGNALINSLYFTGQPVVSRVTKGSKVYEGLSILSGDLKIIIKNLPERHEKPETLKQDMYIHRRVSVYQDVITPVSISASIFNLITSGNILNALVVLLVLAPSGSGTALSCGLKSYSSVLNKFDIYLKNPNSIEKIIKTDVMVFDKTGTLTYGVMKIQRIDIFDKNYDAKQILSISAACEVDNFHPISVTFQSEVVDDYDLSKLENSIFIPSEGVEAVYDSHNVLIGSKKLMDEKGIDIIEGVQKYKDYINEMLTPVFISIDGKLTAIIVMKDVLRKGSHELVDKIKNENLKKIILLTGDNEEKARKLASELGIKEVIGNCDNQKKHEIIMELKKAGTVMMIGDGVNDISAMKEADISVSFASTSCDRVKANSDCVIFEDDISRVYELICLSKKAYSMIHHNVSISQIYNAVFGILGVLDKLNAFSAKSINTINSILVLLLNKRIEFFDTPNCKKRLN